MTDPELEKTLGSARRAGPGWNAGRQQQINWSVLARLDKVRRGRPLTAFAIAGAAAAALALYAWKGPRTAPPADAPAATARPLSSTLADGSRITLDEPSTLLRKTTDAPSDVLYELDAGGARFEVARRPARVFRVRAGEVTVQVIGTGFRLRRQASRCQVAVEHGRVLVSWWGGSRELGAGETGVFPPERRSQLAPPPAPPAPASPEAAPSPAVARAVASHAHGEPHHADSSPDRLFAIADRAREGGNPELAVGTLREIVRRFPDSPHAAAAAFTTGRLLLESLGKPREAAAAFAEARARARGQRGPLAEDALAREVEALHAAGDRPAARARAQLYRSLFPAGVRLQSVARFGGLEQSP